MSARTSAAELHSSKEPASPSSHLNTPGRCFLAKHSGLVCKHHPLDKAEASLSIVFVLVVNFTTVVLFFWQGTQ